VLHRLSEIGEAIAAAVASHDWTGVYPALHAFCAADLSAFYFDVRKDALYCDRPDVARRRAVRSVLDLLHRCLTLWLAPVLVFTAEDAWCARFGEESSVHLQDFPAIPAAWADPALAAKWERLRGLRREATAAIETARREGVIGASLQAALDITLPAEDLGLLDAAGWEDLAIVSQARLAPGPAPAFRVHLAPGQKCVRCWRVREDVGADPRHPALCPRCADAVESGLVCRPAA
jgi:isoleucyl-tRNA synthetase